MGEKCKRTRAAISQEIDLRQRTINKFTGIACPLKQALSELQRRVDFERKMIAQLAAQLDEREREL